MDKKLLKEYLDEKYAKYSADWFIETDPISIPHRFTRKQDIEIAAFLSAIIAWGQRKTIINNANLLMHLMEDDPYNFILNHSIKERERFKHFVHRTFNGTDCVWFTRKLQEIYQENIDLEAYFLKGEPSDDVARKISSFKLKFMSGAENRTVKHLADPLKGSTAKRLNMFLRWMVRKDEFGIDFGIWKGLKSKSLYIPLDVHTARVGRKLGLLKRTQNDWKAVEELTLSCLKLDANDPVKYDFALFGIGAFNDI
jgi:uncharacterized protein (TIGR02757 family)